jgi:hypothetical protein
MKKPMTTIQKIVREVLLLVILFSFSPYTSIAQNSDVVGKITVGYQGWFATVNDGSPINTWWHYTKNGSQSPSPENNGIISWPEVREYTSTYITDWPRLGSGQSAKLFSSFNDQTINTQFGWMQQNGIDCAALQRFNPNGVEGPIRDAITAKVRTAAESHAVKFYIMYDVSGWTNMQSEVKADWVAKMSQYTASPAYARHNGKPVVCLWGFGFNDGNHPFTAEASLDVINWFKAQGCYVIGGVPTYWRTEVNDSKPNFLSAYSALDMISPWMVGRMRTIDQEDSFYTNVNTSDQAYCNAHGIDYQPCILPGNLQDRDRRHGDFMWRQFYNLIGLGVQGIYISMFDEYNEGNQIAKTADSYFDIPTNPYFLPTSEDGTYVSSDFYLRLVGKGGRVLKGLDPLTPNVTIPLSNAPIYFRTTFEAGYDAMPNWINSPDSSAASVNVSALKAYAVQQNGHTGSFALRFEGNDNSATQSKAYMKVFDVNIPVKSASELSFWTFPTNAISRYLTLDLVMTDGTKLRNTAAVDSKGVSMKPSQGRGIVNAWAETVCNIGQWLNGKTIDKIIVAYDHDAETGKVFTYLDDIAITDGSHYGDLPGLATVPTPAPEATNLSLETTLGWTAGASSTSHDVYLGTAPMPEFKGNYSTAFFNPGTLAKNTTYYWRVDERNLAGKTTGTVWKFTTAATGNTPEVDHTDPVGTGTITARNELSKLTAKYAFDNRNATKWIDIGPIPSANHPAWIQTKLPHPAIVNELTIASADILPKSDPANFALKASNNGSSWTTLATWKDQKWNNRLQKKSFPLANSAPYTYYRLEITKNQGNLPLTQIAEIQLIGPASIGNSPEVASQPFPSNGAIKASLSPVLAWRAGSLATSHTVYFGTSPTPNYQVNQTDTAFFPGKLATHTTYYWRVDEKNNSGTTAGPVWSFTTVGSSNTLVDPCDSLTGWNGDNLLTINSTDQKEGTGSIQASGSGTPEFFKVFSPTSTVSNARLEFWYYVSDVTKFNGENQIELGSGGRPDLNEFDWSMPGLVNGWNFISLSLGSASLNGSPNIDSLNWFRIYHFKNDSMVTQIDDIRLVGEKGDLPGFATNPHPSNNGDNSSIHPTLTWSAGYNSTTHDVYFGTTNPPTFKINQIGTSYSPGELVNDITYYWRVNEKNGSGTTEGPVWNFTTAPAAFVPGLVDNCDHAAGWNSSSALSENTTDQKEGKACLQADGSGIDEFSKVFGPSNMDGYQTLQFWYYVSDVTKMEAENQLELGSGGHPDADEFHWSLSSLVNGWNLINLNMSDAGIDGSPNVSALNWFRLYHVKNGALTTRIDDIHLVGNSNGRTAIAGLETVEKSDIQLSVFPNPTSSVATVDYQLAEQLPVAIQLFDMQGAGVKSVYNHPNQPAGRYQVDMETNSLPAGMYIVRLGTQKSAVFKKVVVLK